MSGHPINTNGVVKNILVSDTSADLPVHELLICWACISQEKKIYRFDTMLLQHWAPND